MNATRVEVRLVELLTREGLWLCTAESCTGGLIAHRITEVPGASACFLGGAVAYADALKQSLLGVSETALLASGAVSEAVAREMAEGARDQFRGDLSIAVTGIAGPGGGTPEKPVGLVYTAVAWHSGCDVLRYEFSGTRDEIKTQTADAALEMLWERVQ